MKKYTLFYILILSFNIVFAQNIVEKTDSGSINGARYKIFFPKNWNKKLVMYAHGYEFMGAPLQSSNPKLADRFEPFLTRGFAVACSDYRLQGFALPEGVDDTEALRAQFFKQYGTPDSCFMVGHSMGGGITIATLENFGKNYQGGLPLCPLSSRPYLQCRKEFDMYATFNALFPNVISSLADVMNINNPYKAISFPEMMPKAEAIKKELMKDSALAVQFAKRFDLKLSDLPFSLLFNENVLRDIAHKNGGNPFDNTNTLYSGFPDDEKINREVVRLPATEGGKNIFARYDRTGNIDKPIVLMHTTYDQLIPPTYGVVNFENMIHEKGKDKFLTVKYTTGQGHCNFTPQQTGEAFDALRNWVKTGKKPQAGEIK